MSKEAADWYSGTVLADTMAGFIETLSTVTEENWTPDHTGGGCFWIACYLSDELWNGIYLAVTGSEGPLLGDDTVANVEQNEDGWIIGVYDGTDYDQCVIRCDGPYATEELPLKARDLIHQLRKEHNL